MPKRRRFFTPSLFGTNRGDELTLDPSESHHSANVLKLRSGDEVEVFDGDGRAAKAQIELVSAERVTFRRLENAPTRESPLEIQVALAMLKGDKMSYAIQKLTEIGVSAITPVASERAAGAPRVSDGSLDRWRRIALSAAKQCGRSRVPKLARPAPLAEVLEHTAEPIFLLEPSAQAPSIDMSAGKKRATILIGPEGGWTKDELRVAEDRELTAFSLGPRVLRSETAAVAAASLLQWIAGDWGRRPSP